MNILDFLSILYYIKISLKESKAYSNSNFKGLNLVPVSQITKAHYIKKETNWRQW